MKQTLNVLNRFHVILPECTLSNILFAYTRIYLTKFWSILLQLLPSLPVVSTNIKNTILIVRYIGSTELSYLIGIGYHFMYNFHRHIRCSNAPQLMPKIFEPLNQFPI